MHWDAPLLLPNPDPNSSLLGRATLPSFLPSHATLFEALLGRAAWLLPPSAEHVEVIRQRMSIVALSHSIESAPSQIVKIEIGVDDA